MRTERAYVWCSCTITFLHLLSRTHDTLHGTHTTDTRLEWPDPARREGRHAADKARKPNAKGDE